MQAKTNISYIIGILALLIVFMVGVNIYLVTSLSSASEVENVVEVVPAQNLPRPQDTYVNISGAGESSKPHRIYVNATILEDRGCAWCLNGTTIAEYLDESQEELGIDIKEKHIVDYTSNEGKRIVDAYNITEVPTLILSSEAWNSQDFVSAWSEFGTQEKDGSFVLRYVYPPYREVATGRIRGLVEIIELVDENCTACYNVSEHKTALELTFGAVIVNVTRYDYHSQDGIGLVEKYGIKAIPTVLISPEMGEYLYFDEFWADVGEKADDGWYVFRNFDALVDAYGENLTYVNITASSI
ncbi:MAG: hypothetical protein QXP42_01585 [Candidatus Micrarchaeia archaeon]